MKKKYVTPEMEIVETEMACIMAGSPEVDDWGNETGGNGNPAAPGMMSFDDIDEDYMDEDNI